jgi:hypothetical protein
MILPRDIRQRVRPHAIGERARRVVFKSGGGEQIDHRFLPATHNAARREPLQF